MTEHLHVDTQNALFIVTAAGTPVRTLSLDVCAERIKQYAEALGVPEPHFTRGSPEQYAAYEVYEEAVADKHLTRVFYEPGTPAQVVAILETFRSTQEPLRLFIGDPDTGEDFLLGLSPGVIRESDAAIRRPRLHHPGCEVGIPLLTRHVLRIVSMKTKKELYRHPRYQAPSLEVVALETAVMIEALTGMPEPHSAFVRRIGDEDSVVGWFDNPEIAQCHADFLMGLRHDID